MKKLFITLFLFVFCVSVSGAGIVDSLKSVIARKNFCVKDTTPIYQQTGVEGASNMSTGVAFGQMIVYSGGNWRLHSVKIHSASISCVAELRIGTAQNLATTTEPYEAWTNQSLTVDTGWNEIISVDNDTFTSGVTYYVALAEISGECWWNYQNPGDFGGDTYTYRYADGADWDLDTAVNARDATMEVYKCQ